MSSIFAAIFAVMLLLRACELAGAAIAWKLECAVTGYCR